ncbi:hypothetical protein GCM10010357_61070 [Streptomyces luteireticuli]|uniref:Uncharacterized protein n=1 Tax=Streptomyces luteireticuli TaxID=173858 RepID=A0ABN0Z3B1_9ACTN
MSAHLERFPEVTPSWAARCCVCNRETGAPVPVGYIPSASGSGYTRYACPEHATDAGPHPDDIIRNR